MKYENSTKRIVFRLCDKRDLIVKFACPHYHRPANAHIPGASNSYILYKETYQYTYEYTNTSTRSCPGNLVDQLLCNGMAKMNTKK